MPSGILHGARVPKLLVVCLMWLCSLVAQSEGGREGGSQTDRQAGMANSSSNLTARAKTRGQMCSSGPARPWVAT